MRSNEKCRSARTRAALPSARARSGCSSTLRSASRQRFRPIGVDEDAGRIRDDQFRNSADPGCDDRKSGRHGFEDAVWARLGSRRQHEDVALRQKRRDVTPFSEKCHVCADSEARHTVPEFFPQWAVSDEYELRVRAPADDLRDGVEERVVAFFSAQVGDRDDATPRPRRTRGCRRKRVAVDTVRDRPNLARGHAFAAELRRGGSGVRDHGVRRLVRQSLTEQVSARLVRRENLAPVADAHVDAGERGRRQAKDVRVELAGMHDAGADAAAPRGERQRAARRPGPGETSQREYLE